jgi:hypothetical protein
MGDTAKEWTADQIAASFAVLTKDTKVDDQEVQPIGSPINVSDGASAWNDNVFQSAGVAVKKGA